MRMLRTARLAGAAPAAVRLAGTALAAATLLPAASATAVVHTVAPGETLWGIAAANGLPPSAVAAANGLSPDAHLIAGRNLTIPPRGAVGSGTVAGTAAPGAAAAPAPAGSLRIRPGDTLSD